VTDRQAIDIDSELEKAASLLEVEARTVAQNLANIVEHWHGICPEIVAAERTRIGVAQSRHMI